MAITKDKIRDPNVAGSFYEADPPVLSDNIALFLKQGKPPSQTVKNARIHGLISPHAGYRYCGNVMASVYRLLVGKPYTRVILIGPSHSVGFRTIAFDTASAWKTPLGTVPVDTKINETFLFHEEFDILPRVFDREHSLEVQVPFLQAVLPSFTLIPLCTGQDLPHEMIAETISPLLSDSTIVVVSSDFSHYHPEKEAVSIDQMSIRAILSKDASNINRSVDACGLEGIEILNDLSVRHHWKPVLVDYQTSGNVTRDFNAVVGYAGIAYV